ncbi:MAG: T9SS type A sorting domain-containing protein [Bacteroidetes bacterium]|nr:T9SS type A sorting domain-containing protein [Bacteroidota bacterium]
MKNFLLLLAMLPISIWAQVGSTCTDPQALNNPLVYTSAVQWTTSYDDHWYSFTPDSTGLYIVSTCNVETCDSKIWVYDNCPTVVSEWAEGTYSFNDDFCDYQSQVTVNFAAGTTYYIRIGDYENSCDETVNFTLQFVGQIYGCTDPLACNFNPMATQDDGSCAYYPSPFCNQPDLQMDSLALINSLYVQQHFADDCDIAEGCVTGFGNRWVLAFSSKINNIGDEDYYLGNPNSNPGMFTTENCHGHTHYEGYGDYRLLDVQGNLIPAGHKNGFCVMDLCGFGQYNCGDMGISAGCYDIYGAGTQCQWVDITDIPSGQYRLMAIVNPEYLPDALGRIESNNENNAANICLEINWNNGTPSFQVLAECTQYVDCAGEINGSALPDCQGVCNGPNLFADINGDTLLNATDITLFMTEACNNALAASDCNDLNGNGNLSIYDIALAQNCMMNQNNGTIWNNDCQFPQDLINPNAAIGMAIQSVNLANGYLDIEISSISQNILAAEFTLDGVHITGATMMSLPNLATSTSTVYNTGTGMMTLAHDGNFISMSNSPSALCRVYFDAITANLICLNDIVDVVNSNYERLPNYIYGNCFSSSTGLAEAASVQSLIIKNNPVSDILSFEIPASFGNKNITMQIIDAVGKTVVSDVLNTTTNQVAVSHLSSGVYQIIINNEMNESIRSSWMKQ